MWLLDTFIREVLLTIHTVKEGIEVDKLGEGHISLMLIPMPISTEDDLQWKTTFGGRRPSVEDNLWWKITFGERRTSEEDNLC